MIEVKEDIEGTYLSHQHVQWNISLFTKSIYQRHFLNLKLTKFKIINLVIFHVLESTGLFFNVKDFPLRLFP